MVQQERPSEISSRVVKRLLARQEIRLSKSLVLPDLEQLFLKAGVLKQLKRVPKVAGGRETDPSIN